MLKEIKKGLIFGITAGISMLVIGISYAAFVTITEVGTTDILKADTFNEIIRNQKDLNDRLISLNSKQLVTAWVSFDGIDCPGNICSIKESYNVSSVTKLSTGQYKVSFINTMTTSDYSVNINGAYSYPGVTSARSSTQWSDIALDYSASNSFVYIATSTSNSSTYRDLPRVSVQVFGGK